MSRPKTRAIELRDGLPRYREDFVAWICERLPECEPCSIPSFMRHCGLEPRPHGSGSPAYHKLLAAFAEGEREGRLSQNGRNNWRVARASSPALRAS